MFTSYRRTVQVLTTTVGLLLVAATPALAAPNPTPGLPKGVEGKFDTLLGMAMAVVIAACVGGIFICAGKLALAHRHGEAGSAASGLLAVGAACILVGSGAGIVAYLV